MLIALFALAHLPIFRKTPPPPPTPSPSEPSPRCGIAEKPQPTPAVIRISAPAIDAAAARMNTSAADQDSLGTKPPPIAANGNLTEPKEVEIINFLPHEKQCCRVIKTNHTRVLASGGVHNRGSSKVKLKNIVDYKWERKYYYPGHLVAVHRDGKHLAYAINVNNKATGMEGMVRVCNISTSMRALIKGMSGEVLDLQFAHTDRERILAVIDVTSLFVYKVDLIEGNLVCNLVLKVEDPIANYSPEYDMVSWCPYVCHSSNATAPPISEEEDENQLLIWSRSSQFQCFHVKMIVSEHGRGKIQPAALETGYLKIEEESLITCAALSPDGTTVAAACADGLVRFYQIYLFDVRNHRCLHEWKPHDGKKVCSLFFLDNINKPVEDSYWQHVITTSDANTEIKLWNCSLWECLQTINVLATIPPQPANFIAGIDRSANYLVLSSLDSLAVYVMQIGSTASEGKASDGEGGEEGGLRIQNIAEFKLSSGILSFSIVNATVRQLKSSIESYYPFEESDDFDDDSNHTSALVLHMFVVQAKSLQECQIIYQPCVSLAEKSERRSKRSKTPENNLLIKQEPESSPSSTVQLEALFAKSAKRSSTGSSSAIVAVAAAAAAAPSAILQDVEAIKTESPKFGSSYPQVNLMTPDAFSASGTSTATAVVVATSTTSTAGADSSAGGGESIDSAVLNTLRMLASVTAKTGADNSNANLLNLMNNTLIEDREQQKQLKEKLDARKKFVAIDRNPERNVAENLASGGSSPSREVQEIMATQEDADAYEAELENLVDDDDDDDDDDEEEELANSSPLLGDRPEPGSWPLVKLQSLTNSAELQNAAQIMSQAVQNTNNGNVPPTLGGGGTSVASNSNNNTASTLNTSNTSSSNNNAKANTHAGAAGDGSSGNGELNAKMELLLDLVKAQSKQLNKLEHDIAKLQKQQQQVAVPAASSKPDTSLDPKSVNQLAYKIEMQLSKLMEQYLKRYENEHKKKLTEFLAARESQNRELRDSVLQVLNQYVMNHFTDIIGNVLNMELQRQLLPRVNAKMDQLQAQIQVEMAQKLSVFDKTVKENIGQVCKSKQFLDAFGKSVLIGVQASLQTAFIESMSSTLIPAYEKSSQNMFKQLHDAFSVGIKDFMVQFNTYLQHMPQPQAMGGNSEELNNKLTLLKQLIESSLHKHRTELTDAMLETQREVKSLEILLARQVQETIRAELRKHMESQNMAMRSQAATPAPTYDLRDSIKQLLLSGQINKAFHQALLANDLSLVEFTLRHTDSNLAFAPEGCRLEQKVLLSLIQQISADMSNHNELKQRYLNEALLAINMADPITREHAPKVLSELYRNCQQFIKNCPKNSQFSNVRLLMKAIITYRDQLK